MLIQALLIVALVVIAVYFVRNAANTRGRAGKRLLFLLFTMFAIVAVIDPELVTWLARRVGVGRGADLLLYVLVVSFIFFALNTYVWSRRQEYTTVKLARALALHVAATEGVDAATFSARLRGDGAGMRSATDCAPPAHSPPDSWHSDCGPARADT